MSIWDKMYKWWEQGLISEPAHAETIKTFRVVFVGNHPPVIVHAATMDNHGGLVSFTLDGTIIASFPSADVVGVEVKS